MAQTFLRVGVASVCVLDAATTNGRSRNFYICAYLDRHTELSDARADINLSRPPSCGRY